MRVVKWFDNRPFTLASTCTSVYPLCNVDRWDRSQRQSISVCCPAIVGKCNQNMGGVDALDALVWYYRIGIRSKKYYHRFFSSGWCSCHDWMAFVQTRLRLFWRFKFKAKRFVELQNQCSWSFDKKGKDIFSKKRGRPSLELMSDGSAARSRSAATCRPQDDVWGDKISHWLEVGATRQRCKNQSCSGKTVILCSKCNVHLCLNKNKNCFKLYSPITLLHSWF